MKHYLVMGHIEDQDSDYALFEAETPAAAVQQFMEWLYRDCEDEYGVPHAQLVAGLHDGLLPEEIEDLPQCYIEYAVESESPIKVLRSDEI